MLRTHFSRQNVPRPKGGDPKVRGAHDDQYYCLTLGDCAARRFSQSFRPPLHTDRPKLAGHASTIDAPHSKRLCSIRPSIGTENSIPEEMDHREIGVRMPVMNEVKCLFASEPSEPLKPRSLYVVFFVEKNVRVE